ncbi:MAG TPA: hypothetical protein VIW92_15760 [Thermoanaerobaculia bacterium]
MSVSIGDFIGAWKVSWVDGQNPWFQPGWILMMGTDSAYGDLAPSFNGEYQVCVGFAVVDQTQANPVLISTGLEQEERPQALQLLLSGEQLRWKGYYGGVPLYIYISLSETWTPAGNRYLTLYGSTTYGDPEQVAVWGGSGTPPPPPPPET